MRIALGRGRSVEVSDENVALANRFATGVTQKGLGVAFIHDDGTTAAHVGTILVPRERVGLLVASVVGAAARLGVSWQEVVEDPLAIEDDSIH